MKEVTLKRTKAPPDPADVYEAAVDGGIDFQNVCGNESARVCAEAGVGSSPMSKTGDGDERVRTRSKFAWDAGDLKPAWLRLAPDELRGELARMASAAPRCDEERVRRILCEQPWPTTREQARDRVAEVIQSLMVKSS